MKHEEKSNTIMRIACKDVRSCQVEACDGEQKSLRLLFEYHDGTMASLVLEDESAIFGPLLIAARLAAQLSEYVKVGLSTIREQATSIREALEEQLKERLAQEEEGNK